MDALHASFPQSVALLQLRFTSIVMVNFRGDLHPEGGAHAGRTSKKRPIAMSDRAFPSFYE